MACKGLEAQLGRLCYIIIIILGAAKPKDARKPNLEKICKTVKTLYSFGTIGVHKKGVY